MDALTPSKIIPIILDQLHVKPVRIDHLQYKVANQAGIAYEDVNMPSGGHTFASIFFTAIKFLHESKLIVTGTHRKILKLTASGHLTASDEGLIRALQETARQIQPPPAIFSTGKPGSTRQPPPPRARIVPLHVRKKAVAMAKRIVDSLPEMPLASMFTLWENATKQAKSKKADAGIREAAVIVLGAITEERRRRVDIEPASAIREGPFRWPSTTAEPGSGDLHIEAEALGMLAMAGYRVGRTRGVEEARRLLILSDLFERDLPSGGDEEYAAGWGDNGSAARLKKMAYALAALTRNAKRRPMQNLEEAIEQWEADLAFLHDRFYVGQFGFAWPETSLPEINPDTPEDEYVPASPRL